MVRSPARRPRGSGARHGRRPHREQRAARAALYAHDEPRLAVAAINPHGGEGGHFGDEEITALRPAVEKAAAEGLGVVGPIPADSVWSPWRWV
ncbi:4-hydroxythreonine-4-phosphate dehydrogenase PdxA [Streptomyces sp. 8N616]|uniref:4-hydroxythreonine-4-phosphate dehydrogenase PdxA n=1 Tax=Streptomyces sp. 8N616 TaxID=3457414 RepID=UPI003FCF714F